jgi:hypothetical protein
MTIASTASTSNAAAKPQAAPPLMSQPAQGSMAAHAAEIDQTLEYTALEPDEYQFNYFIDETPEQKANWKRLFKYLNDSNNQLPHSWPGPKDHEGTRPLILNNKWTCWSIRCSDLGFVEPVGSTSPRFWTVKSNLIQKLKHIGYPALIDRYASDPAFQDTPDGLITPQVWEGMVAAGCIPIYPLKNINEQWVKCSVPLCCAKGEYRPDSKGVLHGPWGIATPAPQFPDEEIPLTLTTNSMTPPDNFTNFTTGGHPYMI